jgi:hypothetical protein
VGWPTAARYAAMAAVGSVASGVIRVFRSELARREP